MTTPDPLRKLGGQFASATPSDYRYLTTNLISGALMGDWLPLEPQSFSMTINGGGTFTGSLSLIPGSPQQNATNLAAITPRKAVLWVLQDGVPIWSGVLYDWVPTTILQQQLPIQGATMESILSRRIIDTDLVYTSADVFDMARGICQFAFSKTPNGQVAGITYSSAESGIVDTLTFDGSQNQDCLAALGTLVSTYGIEFSFRPYMDQSGGLHTNVDLGYPYLGQPYPASGLAYSFPGNLLDYEFTATGSTCANSLIATAQDPGDTGVALTGTAQDATDIGNGYPLLEKAISATGVNFSTDSQLDSYAAGVLPSVTATQLAPLLVLGNGQYPPLNVTQLGSYASVALTSAMHPAGANGTPGFSATGRIVSWEAYPPTSQQAEYSQLQIGAMPFEGSALAGQNITTGGSTGGTVVSGGGAGAGALAAAAMRCWRSPRRACPAPRKGPPTRPRSSPRAARASGTPGASPPGRCRPGRRWPLPRASSRARPTRRGRAASRSRSPTPLATPPTRRSASSPPHPAARCRSRRRAFLKARRRRLTRRR